jgi:hypothetical protein
VIRRLAEALLEEANIPKELRETFFPPGPEQFGPRSPVEVQRPTRVARERVPQPLPDDEEAQLLERERRRPRTSGRIVERRGPVVSGVRPGTRLVARDLFRTRTALRQAILVREVLGPPKSLQRPDQDSW